ncbi:MAG TPA: response regulator [Flavobacterium sp.]|jgi:CheY-like chemotaxis protein
MDELKDLHIIIAEDDPDDGEIILASFSKHESFAKVNVVSNGKELLDNLKDASAEKPDVILTDINMPILSGIEVLEAICEDSELSQIPAFVYSTSINPIYEVQCMKLGTKGFIIKPFRLKDFDNIPTKIIEILKKTR